MDPSLLTFSILGKKRKSADVSLKYFFFSFFWLGFYSPFKNISLISSRSFIKGGQEPGEKPPDHPWAILGFPTCDPSKARTTAVRNLKQGLTFHAHCLHLRQCAWNFKTCFLGKTRNLSICRLLRVVKVKIALIRSICAVIATIASGSRWKVHFGAQQKWALLQACTSSLWSRVTITILTVLVSTMRLLPFENIYEKVKNYNHDTKFDGSDIPVDRILTLKALSKMRQRTYGHKSPAKIQISLRSRAVWSESSLDAVWIAKDVKFLHAENEDTDQTAQMRRLFRVFLRRTCQKVCFLTLWLNHDRIKWFCEQRWSDYVDA